MTKKDFFSEIAGLDREHLIAKRDEMIAMFNGYKEGLESIWYSSSSLGIFPAYFDDPNPDARHFEKGMNIGLTAARRAMSAIDNDPEAVNAAFKNLGDLVESAERALKFQVRELHRRAGVTLQ